MIEIIAFKKEDARDLAQCVLSLATSIWASTKDPYFDLEPVTVEEIEAQWHDAISNENTKIFIAKEGQKAVGYIQGDIIPCFIPISKVKKVGYISGAYVDPEYRKQGIMRELEAQIVAFFQSKGVRYVELNVISKNAAAQVCWENLGYRTFREQKRKEIEAL